jgi:hypothetical protein
MNDQGNRNAGVEHPRHSRLWGNREKAAAAIDKSVSMSCADRVVDERVGPVQTVPVVGLGDVSSPHDKNKANLRGCVEGVLGRSP